MGEIFRATDTTLGRASRSSCSPSATPRTRRSASASRARRSPSRGSRATPTSSRSSTSASTTGRPYIVMEYLAGGSLADRLARDGAQPLGRALDWLEQAAAALDAAHRRASSTATSSPRTSCSTARAASTSPTSAIASAAGLGSLTETGTVLGTAGYLSPEQARGETATPASDRYALAVVAFELLTGRPAVRARVADRRGDGARERPDPAASEPSTRAAAGGRRRVSPAALAKEPEHRYGSCAEFVARASRRARRAAGDDAWPRRRPSRGRRGSRSLGAARRARRAAAGRGVARGGAARRRRRRTPARRSRRR